MNALGLTLRPLVADDLPYVAKSWLMCITDRDASGKKRRGYQRRKAYEAALPRVTATLQRSAVWVAVHPSAPATVHGFIVVSHSHRVEFLYVPLEMRHNGIEALLYTAAQPAADQESECNVQLSKPSCSGHPSQHPAVA